MTADEINYGHVNRSGSLPAGGAGLVTTLMLNVRVTEVTPFVAVTKNCCVPQLATAGTPFRTPAVGDVAAFNQEGNPTNSQVTPVTEETNE